MFKKCSNHDQSIVVIVVEDDPLVRMAAVWAFEDAGFEVLESENASAAMHIFAAEGARVRALFTDVDMPGAMNGLMLARQIGRDWPAVAVVVASGQAAPAVGDMPANGRFFRKPYSLDQIVAYIRAGAVAA